MANTSDFQSEDCGFKPRQGFLLIDYPSRLSPREQDELNVYWQRDGDAVRADRLDNFSDEEWEEYNRLDAINSQDSHLYKYRPREGGKYSPDYCIYPRPECICRRGCGAGEVIDKQYGEDMGWFGSVAQGTQSSGLRHRVAGVRIPPEPPSF